MMLAWLLVLAHLYGGACVCRDGWVTRKASKKGELDTCYKLIGCTKSATKANFINFETASQQCLSEGGALVKIEGEEENEFLSNQVLLGRLGDTVAWIGLSRCNSSACHWTADGSTFSAGGSVGSVASLLFSPEYRSDTGSVCVILDSKDSRWKRKPCHWAFCGVCEYEDQCSAVQTINHCLRVYGDTFDCVSEGEDARCQCPRGYRPVPRFSGSRPTRDFTCSDVDECEENTGTCSHSAATCVNSDGSFECFCPKTGYFFLPPPAATCSMCPPGWVMSKRLNSGSGIDASQAYEGPYCYQYHRERRTHSQAEKICEAQGATLVTLHSEQENDFVLTLLLDADNEAGKSWIGLKSITHGEDFQWLDSSPVNWEHPRKEYPGDGEGAYCTLMLSEDGQWKFVPCNSKHSFVCKMNGDECRQGLHNCSVTSLCIDTSTSYRCECPSGFTGDPTESCSDINECSNSYDMCPSDAECTNLNGSFQCKCPLGRHLGVDTSSGEYRRVCVDVNECLRAADNRCDAILGRCTNTEGSFSCQCVEGAEGDGVSCFDINECEAHRPKVCHDSNMECINRHPGYECHCVDGFKKEKQNCIVDTNSSNSLLSAGMIALEGNNSGNGASDQSWVVPLVIFFIIVLGIALVAVLVLAFRRHRMRNAYEYNSDS